MPGIPPFIPICGVAVAIGRGVAGLIVGVGVAIIIGGVAVAVGTGVGVLPPPSPGPAADTVATVASAPPTTSEAATSNSLNFRMSTP
jgi:hypothetical protein